ncbi:hypothetical protein PC129_g9915 [Phytophthora cactorum]|uniref:Transposase Tc1-like domain-containing protein n=1 Tax=Phytophthora cactorum TaxID=29920 RepID=A0A329SN36_9STRA|nr:hypothetical protein Pcac1_g2408 [Phytophthora cactorum]KAG2838432.1 hypothetical protein PC112_g4476 [Phytophthora cactorum]KAG2840103.1 hypothetical protein PC111_g3594 [Phytophthora cactorum]KAG2865152.1 hypothetical protein PC113_g3931 [Phytophthora cactorum]KAG2935582.1 hypothetical protein PC114_g518 [Phytophthora cactorum]
MVKSLRPEPLWIPSTTQNASRVQPLATNPRPKNGTRRAIINSILRVSVDGIVPRGVITAIGHQYGRHPTSISRVWDRHLRSEVAGVEDGDHISHMKGNVGRKPHDRDELVEKIRAVPIQQRQNQRQLAEASGVSKRLVASLLRDGLLHRVTDRIKPSLTDANRIARLQFALSHLNESTMKFDEGYVYVDEKWFNEDKDDRAYLLLDGEEPPPRGRKSKRFILKTMFLAAVARPM